MKSAAPFNSQANIPEIEGALSYIPNVERDVWVDVGMALHAELGEAGFPVWDSWASTADNYKEADARAVWKSIKPGAIGIGTLFHHAKQHGWQPKNGTRPNLLRDEAARLRCLKRRQEAEQAAQDRQATVADQCAERWQQAAEAAADHPYLVKKQCRAYGIKQEGNNLLIPMRDSNSKLWSLQSISPDGEKLFAPGGRAKGMYYRIKGTGPVVICEGYATGASIHEATGYNVVITFSCGNLEAVAKLIRDKLPGKQIIIAADSAPASTTDKARAVAQTIGAALPVPSVESDFNDLFQIEGPDVVRAQIDTSILQDHTNLPDGDGDVIEWSDPEPLPDALVPVDPFNDLWLPESIRSWVADMSERIQCPPDFPAVGAMVSLASVLGRKIAIRPKKYDDWMEVPNLWGAVVGRPGIMKSPALAESMRPLNRLALDAQNQHREALEAADNSAEIRAAQVKALRGELASACKGKGTRTAEVIAAEMASLKEEDAVDTCRRFKVNDATVEKLGELLSENPNGLLLFRDELVGWLRSLDREGAENTRPFFLEAWNGMGGYTYDRIGRGTLHIEHACLGVLGGIQPGPLSVYVRGAIKNGQGADGLLQRIQLLVWPDDNGKWKDVDRYPDSRARDIAYAVFRRLADLHPDEVSAQTDEFSQQPWLRFDDESQELFTEWRDDLENGKLRTGEHEVIESHLSKYRKLIPALALVIHLAEDGSGPVTKRALVKACAWGEYLESHARRIYAAGTAPDLPVAYALLDKIKQGHVASPFKPRDVYRKGWAALDKEGTTKAIEVLAEYGWLHVEQVMTGGRPSTVCHINPAVMP